MHSTAETAVQSIKTSTTTLRKLSQLAGFLSGSNIPAALCSLALLNSAPAPAAASAAGFILVSLKFLEV
jgi:hypothetical protein